MQHIAQLELLTIVVMVKFWKHELHGKIDFPWFMNNGRTRDAFMLECPHELVWVTGQNDIMIKL